MFFICKEKLLYQFIYKKANKMNILFYLKKDMHAFYNESSVNKPSVKPVAMKHNNLYEHKLSRLVCILSVHIVTKKKNTKAHLSENSWNMLKRKFPSVWKMGSKIKAGKKITFIVSICSVWFLKQRK
ncbi:hypothetical protein XENOCAPTIV_020395 [Xenoophorus captivus]|uniref:Uncharacterized protein n=1 Tax=Xenoophorus captivus TaxID=1517983 RepID=A0ABV0QME7_9TELE